MSISNQEKTFYLTLVICTQILVILPALLNNEILLLSSFTDDFFYYIKVAKNIVLGEGSTFNGIVQTNGYHPLWLIILTIFVKLAVLLDVEILIFIKLVIALIIFLSFYLFYKYATEYLTNIFWRVLFVLFIYTWYATSSSFGMETIITIPLFLIFILSYLKNINPYLIGLLISLTTLSRIDSIVIFLVFFGVESFYTKFDFKRLTKIGLGLLPIPVYLLSNIYYFDSLIPVSGMAKSVLKITTLHSATFISLFEFYYKFNYVYFGVFIYSVFNLYRFKQFENTIKVFYITALISVPIYYLQTSLRSDWRLWFWYFYPLMLSVIMLAIPLNRIFVSYNDFNLKIKQLEFLQQSFILFALSVISLFTFNKLNNLNYDPIAVAGIKILDFEKNNPGIYAMGDRSGTVGYLLKSPLIQLEGLVMDTKYLNLLEKSSNIEDVLNKYNTSYYIGTALKKNENNCYMVIEPLQSNGYSRRVESQLCWEEVLRFTVKDSIQGDATTHILKRKNI